ncbi:hypothetical protein NDU88_005119 [Pleurodeles waltl]|uniref:Uncharacterized protein n=1 Tax=Pleurodeles waltl TaxID=8319 RepID=A0AAV7T9P6_PLEWA|nr:hypothetical protein NDU88_005119 [Pleurodeles waltl]
MWVQAVVSLSGRLKTDSTDWKRYVPQSGEVVGPGIAGKPGRCRRSIVFASLLAGGASCCRGAPGEAWLWTAGAVGDRWQFVPLSWSDCCGVALRGKLQPMQLVLAVSSDVSGCLLVSCVKRPVLVDSVETHVEEGLRAELQHELT